MEIKQGGLDIVRRLFDRCVNLTLPARKMKYFFKRYLQFENQYGTEETVETVKDKAIKFVTQLNQ